MSDEEKLISSSTSSIIEEDVSEMEVVDASAVEDSNNVDDERKVSAITDLSIIKEFFSALGSDKNRFRK